LLETQQGLIISCQKDRTTCNRWTRAAILASPGPHPAPVVEPLPPAPRSRWLESLNMPQLFPVHDEPALKSLFDSMTKNIAAHAAFQQKRYVCSEYLDIFASVLQKYHAPPWLGAVVYQESACDRSAKSQFGELGLWQLMPESARTYGLQLIEGEIDERLDPVMSTDAAVHFFVDLESDLGSWDLALAAYDMGPFALGARLKEAGGHASFWALADAGLVPDETLDYVRAIETYAIILTNIQRFHPPIIDTFGVGAAKVIVKPGTRLSLLARAASTTTERIHDLNPAFLQDVVPRDQTTTRVPQDAADRARVPRVTSPR
jgi:hypothetical protein